MNTWQHTTRVAGASRPLAMCMEISCRSLNSSEFFDYGTATDAWMVPGRNPTEMIRSTAAEIAAKR